MEFYATFWALLPPIIAIVLALITKEVYSSLFVGILMGGLFYAKFGLEGTITHIVNDGFISVLSDPWNVGILIFLVILGTIVCLMNKAGGSAAFGNWAQTHIKSRVGAQLATIVLGVLIFIDDYFNCLTVGSVMSPVAKKHRISREKLAYLIDATAAPVCIIAPISSWAAAVSGFVKDADGFTIFLSAIPYNYYALLTLVFMIGIVILKIDFGPMTRYENAAITAGISSRNGEETSGEAANSLGESGEAVNLAGEYKTSGEAANSVGESDNSVAAQLEKSGGKRVGQVIDLVIPIAILILSCAVGMIYTGGFFSGESFVDAFAASDASVGLAIGSMCALIMIIVFYLCRRVLSFNKCMDSLGEGFKAMVPAILILTFAWTLKNMTDSLGAAQYVERIVKEYAAGFTNFLPAIIFIIAALLAFATGTSWGTFGILIPIVVSVFQSTDYTMMIISISACMAGAVCGDHCSPISDTTIMASAGAQCNHVNHVSTQLPYAIAVAVISMITYVAAGFIRNAWVSLAIGLMITLSLLAVLKFTSTNRGLEE